MVFRPHILRYKGKLKKVDAEKMKKIQEQQSTIKKEIESTKAIPKMNIFVMAATSVLFLAPVIFYKFVMYQAKNSTDYGEATERAKAKEEGVFLVLNQEDVEIGKVKALHKH